VNPLVFALALLLFLVSLLVHVLIWRIRRPRHDALALFLTFSTVPAAAMGALVAAGFVAGPGADIAATVLLHGALSACYIASYPAAQALSPSLDILLLIDSSTGGSMSREEILANYSEDILIRERIEDLGRSTLVRRLGNDFSLSPAGGAVALFFKVYRRLLGLPTGEG
jgi:hypothetical protein